MALLLGASPRISEAQITNTVFSDDFSGASIDTAKWGVDAPTFEGGKGDIAPQQSNGVLEFTGTVSEQWWAGATLRALPTFPVSAETNVIVTVDRVAEQGEGTASRSAFWIMDGTKTRYVLFADVRGEEGWRYNRKIGEAGDVPTGGGTILTTFNGTQWDDGGLHQMKAVANGKTVKLYLDNKLGAEVKFPFSSLVFHVGSYARANGDTAHTIWDNFQVQTVGSAAFSATSLTVLTGGTSSNVTVRIPPGVNKTAEVVVEVTSWNPSIAVPVGAVDDKVFLTFPAGGTNEQVLGVRSLGPPGSALFTMTNNIGMGNANQLNVLVIQGPGVRMVEDFAGTEIDTNKWELGTNSFEAGLGTFKVEQTAGALVVSGTLDIQAYWGGASLRTIKPFTASPDMPLSFEIDRLFVDPTRVIYGDQSTAVRTGFFISSADRSQFVFFGQNYGENGWHVNVNPGNPTGTGTPIPAFAEITDTNLHRLKVVADGTTAEVFLDGTSGGKFDFPVTTDIYFDVGAYPREFEDSVKGAFDNVRVENVFPPVTTSPSAVSTILGVNASIVKVTIPRLLNVASPVKVTVTSQNPAVAFPENGVNGQLQLVYAPGATNVQTFKVITAGAGATTFNISNDQGVPVANNLNVNVTPEPVVLFSDNFASDVLNPDKWITDQTPLIANGTLTSDSTVGPTNGTLEMLVHCEVADWPGFALFTKTSFTATASSPAVFELDRVMKQLTLVGGDTSKERSGMWIKDATTNYVFFSQLGSWDATASGWQYNRVIGQPSDNPITAGGNGSGTYMLPVNEPIYNDATNHTLRAEADGTNVRLYVDRVLGAEVKFPFKEVTFGFGTYVNFANTFGNISRAVFDNATVLGYLSTTRPGPLAITRQPNGDVVVTWQVGGILQSGTTLSGTGDWADVTPQPTGNSYTIPAGSLKSAQFLRLRQ